MLFTFQSVGCRLPTFTRNLERYFRRVNNHSQTGFWPIRSYAYGTLTSAAEAFMGRTPDTLQLCVMFSKTAPVPAILSGIKALAWAAAGYHAPLVPISSFEPSNSPTILDLPSESQRLIMENLLGQDRARARLSCKVLRDVDESALSGLLSAPSILPLTRAARPQAGTVEIQVDPLAESMDYVRAYVDIVWQAAEYEWDEDDMMDVGMPLGWYINWSDWFGSGGTDPGPVEWDLTEFYREVVWECKEKGRSPREWADSWIWCPPWNAGKTPQEWAFDDKREDGQFWPYPYNRWEKEMDESDVESIESLATWGTV